jgi:mRNA interferase RelE/StbE
VSRPLVLSGAARRDLKRLDTDVAKRILEALTRFADTGHGDVVRLQGREREWRLRVGVWRAIYTVHGAERALLILRVLPRGEAYR